MEVIKILLACPLNSRNCQELPSFFRYPSYPWTTLTGPLFNILPTGNFPSHPPMRLCWLGLRTCFSWHLVPDSPRQLEYLYGSQSPALEAEASVVEWTGRENVQNGVRRGSSSRLQGTLQSPQRRKHLWPGKKHVSLERKKLNQVVYLISPHPSHLLILSFIYLFILLFVRQGLTL